ncbi:DUF4243 domain-containing protein [Jiella sp. CQZ9-1]|uniref:DUF4243 domain-containing protein n=2 Tax=Jiella flava TaxID=2816857 RepID=A0A939G1T0_9HYPH|nr:DUF4243 domain-containing protein [Jiella flava]
MPAFGSEFALTFANHAPMVLVAQARMGGSPAQMQRFFDFYSGYKRLLPFQDCAFDIAPDDWQAYLGERRAEGAYRRLFDAEMAALGRAALLARWLPRLAPGIGASAFHGLMRTAYGVIDDNDAEIVLGLAYWCATWLMMPARTGTAALTDDPAAVLAHAGSIPAMHGQPVHPLIWHNMRQSFGLPGFETAGDWLAINDTACARCAAASIALFAATQDFCALHAVTGMHWIRVLAPYHGATPEMVRCFWAGVAALMNEMGYPALPAPATLDRWRSLPCPDWPEIFHAACQSLDEHDLSLTFSAQQEEAVYGDPLYRRAAARRLGLIAEMTA